jgi:excisionase family DNA binding protein
MSEWLTAQEAAEHLKVRKATLLLWVRHGKIPAYKLSGTIRHVWRFRQSDLDAILTASSAVTADREAA